MGHLQCGADLIRQAHHIGLLIIGQRRGQRPHVLADDVLFHGGQAEGARIFQRELRMDDQPPEAPDVCLLPFLQIQVVQQPCTGSGAVIQPENAAQRKTHISHEQAMVIAADAFDMLGNGVHRAHHWLVLQPVQAGGEQRAVLFFPLHRNHLFVVCAQPTAGVQPGRFAPVLMIREKSRIIYKKMLPHTNLLPRFEKGAFCRGRAAAKHAVIQSREIRSSQIRAAVVQYSVISNSFTTSVS